MVSITGHLSLHEATTVHIEVSPSDSLCNPCFCLRALIIDFKLEICLGMMIIIIFFTFIPLGLADFYFVHLLPI